MQTKKILPIISSAWYYMGFAFIICSFCMSMLVTAQGTSDQTLANYRKQILELQDQSLYDSALLLANNVLSNPNLLLVDKQFIIYNKFISFHYLGKVDSAQTLLLQLESLVTQKDEAYADYLFSKALVLNKKGNYAEAIDLLLEIINLFKETENIKGLFGIYNSLGVNYKDLNDQTTAKYYYLKAWQLKSAMNNPNSLIMIANNLGSLYNKFNKLDSALYFYNIAIENLKNTNNQFLLAQNFLNVGNIHEKRGDYSKAEASFIQCLAISEKSNLEYGRLLATLNLGNLARLQTKFAQAVSLLDTALLLAKTGGYIREEGYTLERKSWLARDIGDFELAYHLELKSAFIRDSLVSERVRKDATQMQIKYEVAKREKELAELELKNQKLISLIALSLFGFIMLIIVTFWIIKIKNKLQLEKISISDDNKTLIEDIKAKEMELASMALELIQFKKILEMEIDNQDSSGEFAIYDADKNGIIDEKKFISLNRDFEARMTKENKIFFKRLINQYPTLSSAELRLSAYLKLNLSTKEIAQLQSKSVRTIEATRYSLRKKFGINAKENLSSYLLGFDD